MTRLEAVECQISRAGRPAPAAPSRILSLTRTSTRRPTARTTATGTSGSNSWNRGAEDPTDGPDVLALRACQSRAMLATLLLSFGVPMLLGGDETGQTQQGTDTPTARTTRSPGLTGPSPTVSYKTSPSRFGPDWRVAESKSKGLFVESRPALAVAALLEAGLPIRRPGSTGAPLRRAVRPGPFWQQFSPRWIWALGDDGSPAWV
jgi:hypothetical protein